MYRLGMYPFMYGKYDCEDEEDTVVESSPKKPDPPTPEERGAFCRGKNCGQYNEWAPRDPDGTYVCYTCREHHHVR